MSFSGHHKESWSAAWTIEKMLLGLISFMHSKEKTLNGVIFKALFLI
jgi:ubiquitin-protein ligase